MALLSPHVTSAPIARIEFGEGHQLHGVVVRCKTRAQLREIFPIRRALAQIGDHMLEPTGESERDAEVQATLDSAAQQFAELALLSWNIQEPQLDTEGDVVLGPDGEPMIVDVPCDYEHFRALGSLFMTNVMGQWLQTVMGINPNSPPPSSNGSSSAAQNALMEAELASLQS